MAWRIDEQVVRGEIENRIRGRVTGRIWFVGREEPVALELEGNLWRDLAGHVLRFSNPDPKPRDLGGLAGVQRGVVGDITASRKVKVPECSMEEFGECYRARKPFPWHWGNSFYLEWFSQTNGRVVIESARFQLEIDPEAAWTMSGEEEAEQRLANARALTEFMDRMVGALNAGTGATDADADEEFDDEPQSAAEAQADEEAARMDLLMDRVMARLDREESHDAETFSRILDEERERLRRERGEPEEPEPTPEEEAERASWIEEANAAAEEALAKMEAEKWKEKKPEPHPFVERCRKFSSRVHHEIEENGWLPDDAQFEHPLLEIINGTMAASAKLAGALGLNRGDEEWPPPPLFAGNVLVRLKKARGYLRDVLRGLDSADEEGLATVEWRAEIRREAGEILGEVQGLIQEVRQMLADAEGAGEM